MSHQIDQTATKQIIQHIQNQSPACFLKFGDGEYACINKYYGGNCDGDPYTETLRNGLIESFNYIHTQPNTYIGRWQTDNVTAFWKKLCKNPEKIQWADYHTIIIDKTEVESGGSQLETKIGLYKTIRESPLPKIVICNPLLIKSSLLFNTEDLVFVPFRRWFDTQSIPIFESICEKIENNRAVGKEKSILIFSAGMSSKVIIAELHKLYPQNIYLDFGSALDIICTKRDSRGRSYSYETLQDIFYTAGILPPEWNDPKYNYVYEQAQKELGIHLRG